MTKLQTGITTLAFIVTAAGTAWAQTPGTAPPKRPSTEAQAAARDAARAEVERARVAAGEIDQARLMSELMAGHEATLAGHEALALAAEAELMAGVAFASDWAAALPQVTGQAQQRAREQREAAQAVRERERELRERTRHGPELYQAAYELLSDGQWERALELFSRALEAAKSYAGDATYADRALYWTAYAQYKLAQSTEALQTIGELQKAYPESRYLTDAQALAAEVRERAGQPADPNEAENEELKLLALRALQNSDPEQAVPMLESLLRGTESPRLKQRALFVLAQSRSDQARRVLASVARGEHNPDLQLRALQYIGFTASEENRALLSQIYAASSDLDVKRRILRAYGTMKETERLLQAAQSESSPELRREAVRQLGMLRANDALASLYQRESDIDVKQDILRSMFVSGDVDVLLNLARTEPNSELKQTAVRNLGMMPKEKTGDALRTFYESDDAIEVRKAAVMGLYIQKNDVTLVELARKESNAELKKEIVGRLSLMKTKVALDYLMELLNK